MYGSEGSALVTCLGPMYYSRSRRAWIRPAPCRPQVASALDDLVEAVKHDRESSITVEDMVKAQEIVEAVYLSSREGEARQATPPLVFSR